MSEINDPIQEEQKLQMAPAAEAPVADAESVAAPAEAAEAPASEGADAVAEAAPANEAADAVAEETQPSEAADVQQDEPAGAAEEEAATESTPDKKQYPTYATRAEVIGRLAEIAARTDEETKTEVAHLKQQYYKLRQQETDAELQAFIDSEGDASQYVAKADDLEPRLKELLTIQKEARATMVEARNKEMADNLAKKLDILRQMETIALDADNVGVRYNDFQDLQKQFKAVGAVDQQEVAGLWKRYTQLGELFYDALKINKELRDLDFKKNFERKEQLCAEAEALQEQADIIAAFRRLQALHDEWKGLGPVAPADREAIWARFKAASTAINKRHQEHFETLKAQESANEAQKVALCEQIEAIDIAVIKTFRDWEEKTKEVLGLQGQWRKVGSAGRKKNNSLFERFRRQCDAFFGAKTEFFKQNYDLKVALCEKAEALKDSTEWRKTTDLLINLQKEWKTIGPVSSRMSAQLWERFKSACDAFFTAKEAATGGERAAEQENLAKKQQILQRLEELKQNIGQAVPQDVRDLMDQWRETGHVPFRHKEKLHDQYQKLIDFFYEQLDMKGSRQRFAAFKEHVKTQGRETILTERQRLVRQMERLQNDLKTYENNLGFLTSKSKSGNSMLALMERKKEELKKEISELVEKIKVADTQSAEPTADDKAEH